MQTQAKFTGMYKTITTYLWQRFGLLVWAGTSVFLLLYASPSFRENNLLLPAMLVALILVFRLLDDLQNREADMKKNDRIYTGHAEFVILRIFLLAFSVLLFLLLMIVHPVIAYICLGFFMLNLLLYKLLRTESSRPIIPLLKYPFFCFLLMLGLRTTMVPGVFEILTALSLLPAFILFESLSDPSFKISRTTALLLFLAGFAVFFTVQGRAYYFAALIIIMFFSWYLCLQRRIRYAPYIFLLSILTVRMISIYGI
jgi:hypothetical protein